MSGIDGETLRQWRRARGWDVPELARKLRGAAHGAPMPVHDALIRMVRRWEREGLRTERYELLYRALGLAEDTQTPDRDASSEYAGAREIMAWIADTNTTDVEVTELDRAARYLAEAHTQRPAATVLPEVLGVHRATASLLRDGRQRLSQTRELLRVDSELLAHVSLLQSDLGLYRSARDYGRAALMCAQESGSDEGIAWSVLSKTARWERSFIEAAGLASRGYQSSTRKPVRVELAYREANALALFGDTLRARAALRRADNEAENLDDGGPSAWSFPRCRQLIFALNVSVHTGDPVAALRAAEAAEDHWAAGAAQVTATWAQVRAGAAMAHLLLDSIDAATEQLAPVLELATDQRIQTVTGYVKEVDAMLAGPRFAASTAGVALRERIAGFVS